MQIYQQTGSNNVVTFGRRKVRPRVCIADDIKSLVLPCFAHRVIVQPSARVKDVTGRTIVEDVAATLAVPGSRVPA